MNNDTFLKQIGERFGSDIVELVKVNRAFTVTILDVSENNAFVTMTGSEERMSVPLSGISIANAAFKIKPNIGSLAIVALANGAENAPFFLAYSEIDYFQFKRGTTDINWKIDPPMRDENGDEQDGETNDEINLTVGETTVLINKDVFSFNGGSLGGLTKTQELKTQLDKTTQLLQQLITVLSGAPIPEPGNGAPSALQTSLAAAIAGLSLGDFSNIENEKITH